MSENADTSKSASEDQYDVFLAYAHGDEDIASSLQAELNRMQPDLRVWCEKTSLDVGDAFNQTVDEAIAGCGVVLAVWTPHAARSGAFMLEARRALTLRKPLVNLLAGAQHASLVPPLSKYATFPIDHVVASAGRSEGWLPPLKPGKDTLDEELKPVLAKVNDFLRMIGKPASEVSDSLISGLLGAAGQPHSTEFEAMLKSIAPGDPATALEVLLLSGYSEAEINTLISPQRARIADPSGTRPSWGAWQVRPHVRKLAPVHKDNGAIYAAGGFVAAALGAAALWFMGSTLSAGSAGSAGTATTPADSGAQDTAETTSNLSPATARPDIQPTPLPDCTLNSDGSITGAECRLTTDIAPRPVEPVETDSADTAEPVPSLRGCIIRLDGSIQNTPCRLAAPYAISDRDEDELAECVVTDEGAITEVPCRLIGSFEAPDPVEVEVPAETPPERLCITNPDGSITDVPCMMASPTSAPERIEVPGETIVEMEELPVCDTDAAGARLSPGCKLDEEINLAHAICDEDYSNLPCTLTTAPTRLTSDDTARPATSQTTSTPAEPAPMTPIEMPDTLEPCEDAIVAPCQLTVSKAGLFTLSEIAQSFYGDREAWCMVYRANKPTFGSRNETRVSDDPNCIFASDVLDLPETQESSAYNLNGCPPAKQRNRCFVPIER
ncbi:MAG: toll/interleukin-1 receptor domain-containing protein [Hyphomonadaceae bacterium]|nr:toll/interleukin-1 receptor domain-containing protein [Hyphomonadaceae bacterium]